MKLIFEDFTINDYRTYYETKTAHGFIIPIKHGRTSEEFNMHKIQTFFMHGKVYGQLIDTNK